MKLIHYNGKDYSIPLDKNDSKSQIGPLAKRFAETIMAIQVHFLMIEFLKDIVWRNSKRVVRDCGLDVLCLSFVQLRNKDVTSR